MLGERADTCCSRLRYSFAKPQQLSAGFGPPGKVRSSKHAPQTSIHNSYFLMPARQVGAEQNDDVNAKVYVTSTNLMDVTCDAQEDHIVLRIRGKRFMYPFSWTLGIQTDGKSIFKHESNDAWLDQFFNDTGHVPECAGYFCYKRKWYYRDLLETVLIRTKLSANPHALGESIAGSIHTIARQFLKEVCEVPDKVASEII